MPMMNRRRVGAVLGCLGALLTPCLAGLPSCAPVPASGDRSMQNKACIAAAPMPSLAVSGSAVTAPSVASLPGAPSASSSAPTPVPAKRLVPIRARSLSSGSASVSNFCAVLVDGRAVCLADHVLSYVPGIIDGASIDASQTDACAVLLDGTTRCWSTTPPWVPKIGPVVNVKKVALSAEYACALLRDASVTCWGTSPKSRLPWASDDAVDDLAPTKVRGLGRIADIKVSAEHACALAESGTVHCWGRNNFAQLGDGTLVDRAVPRAVVGISNATSISVGYGLDGYGTCVALADGTARCWGSLTYVTTAKPTMSTGPAYFTRLPTRPFDDVRNIKTIDDYDSYLTRAGVARVGWWTLRRTQWMAARGRWGLRDDGTVWTREMGVDRWPVVEELVEEAVGGDKEELSEFPRVVVEEK